jgi:hypothetical protein
MHRRTETAVAALRADRLIDHRSDLRPYCDGWN